LPRPINTVSPPSIVSTLSRQGKAMHLTTYAPAACLDEWYFPLILFHYRTTGFDYIKTRLRWWRPSGIGNWMTIGPHFTINTLSTCAKIVTMETPREEPIYTDTNRRPMAFLFMLAGVAAVLGLIGKEPNLLILGLGVGGYSWLTNAKQFLIFSEYLVVIYGTPRRKVIPFTQISHVEFLSLPTIGDRVRIRMVTGRGMMLQTKNSETFHDQLESALNNFHGTRPQHPLDDRGPDDIDSSEEDQS